MNAPAEDSDRKRSWGLIAAIPVCLVLAVIFLAFSLKTPAKTVGAEPLAPAWYTPKTARGEELKNKVMVGNCFLCHAYWVGIPDPEVVQPRFAHGAIKLDHGANDRCYNCHLILNRNMYAADDGSAIIPENVEQLCARCHGLIYKDWKAGTHGVRRGKWDARTDFDTENFTCTECHDPHSPRFQFKEYTPPPVWPDTLIRSSTDPNNHPEASD